MNETQFVEAMSVEVQRLCSGMSLETAKDEARLILEEFLEMDGIDYGDDRYDWTVFGAADLVDAFVC